MLRRLLHQNAHLVIVALLLQLLAQAGLPEVNEALVKGKRVLAALGLQMVAERPLAPTISDTRVDGLPLPAGFSADGRGSEDVHIFP